MVTISHTGKNAEEKLQEIAEKYDVNKMSVNEKDAMAKRIIDIFEQIKAQGKS
ncbi:MAG: hypothetical protein OCD00_15200 [Colwellia sp.]